MNVTVIAEAGVNHNGDIELAKSLVDVASNAGADFVKFQTFNVNALLRKDTPKAGYQKKNTDINESQYQMIKRLELSESMHEELFAYCKDKEIGFLSTGFDISSVEYLRNLEVAILKIPSGEITNLPYLRYIGSLNSRVLVSTGMSSLGEIEQALIALDESGTTKENITVLQCTTEYPAPMKDVNLMAMVNIGKAFGVRIGYSDHTAGIEVAFAAVALGATVIEKHFTLDRNLPGPDHKSSLEPDELKAMVKGIRNIEKALGNGIKSPSHSEVKNKPVVRKSIVAARKIKAGEIFCEKNITTKRPGTGMSPMRWDEVVGRKARREFGVDELIEL